MPAYLRAPSRSTKTGTERVIGLTPRALAIVLELAEGREPDEALVPSCHRRAFVRASKMVGHDQVITLRDLRHIHASWAGEAGDVRAVQAALGHSDLATTERYLHATAERAASTAVLAAARLEGAQGGGHSHSGHAHPPGESGGGKWSGWQDSNLRLPAPEAGFDGLKVLIECPACAPRLLEMLEVHLAASEGGTAEGAQRAEAG